MPNIRFFARVIASVVLGMTLCQTATAKQDKPYLLLPLPVTGEPEKVEYDTVELVERVGDWSIYKAQWACFAERASEEQDHVKLYFGFSGNTSVGVFGVSRSDRSLRRNLFTDTQITACALNSAENRRLVFFVILVSQIPRYVSTWSGIQGQAQVMLGII